MNKRGYHYLFLLVALVLFVAVFAGIAIRQVPAPAVQTGPSGTFALGTCDELNSLFLYNNCYGPGEYDGYTCMKIMEAKYQRRC